MPVQYWQSLLNAGAPWQTASGTTDSGSTAAAIHPEGAGTGDDPLVPAYGFYQGLLVRVTARGIYTVGSTATNLTLQLVVGTPGTVITTNTVLATSGANALAVSVTNLQWKLEAFIQCRAISGSTPANSLYTHGEVQIQTSAPQATLTNSNMQYYPLPATNGPTAAAVDCTVAHTLGLVATLSQTVGAPTITCTQFAIEMMS